MLRYINSVACTAPAQVRDRGGKCLILLYFELLRQCGCRAVVQCTKISLTAAFLLPRMKLLRRTMRTSPGGRKPPYLPRPGIMPMPTVANPFSEITAATVDSATKLTRISMDSAERVIALQLDFAKTSLEQATRSARALAGAKDVQELLAMRTKSAESAVERLMGYSRSLYEISSEAQSQLSKLAEERMSSFHQSVSKSVDHTANP